MKGEVKHPGAYGIRPGEKLSSVLERSGGFGPSAYPYGAVLMRRDVREMEMNARLEMVRRLKQKSQSQATADVFGIKRTPNGSHCRRRPRCNSWRRIRP